MTKILIDKVTLYVCYHSAVGFGECTINGWCPFLFEVKVCPVRPSSS